LAFLIASDNAEERYGSAPETFGYESIITSRSRDKDLVSTPVFPKRNSVTLSAT
jgi:hypothetical protein